MSFRPNDDALLHVRFLDNIQISNHPDVGSDSSNLRCLLTLGIEVRASIIVGSVCDVIVISLPR